MSPDSKILKKLNEQAFKEDQASFQYCETACGATYLPADTAADTGKDVPSWRFVPDHIAVMWRLTHEA